MEPSIILTRVVSQRILAAREIRRRSPSIVDDIIAEGDKVALFLTARGLHSEPIVLQGTCYTPTGKPFASKQVHLFRARDGLLTEHWSVRNDLTMLLPLGIVQYTTPAGAAERETVLQR